MSAFQLQAKQIEESPKLFWALKNARRKFVPKALQINLSPNKKWLTATFNQVLSSALDSSGIWTHDPHIQIQIFIVLDLTILNYW